MSETPFVVDTFTVPCQHIREYPRENVDGDQALLFMAVKRYTPSKTYSSSGKPLTVLAAGGNGFPKELYEPMWEDLTSCSLDRGFHIKALFIADMAHQGQSAILNRNKTGDDPSWFDVARDLLQLVNYFRSEMTGHIAAIGHSIGATALLSPHSQAAKEGPLKLIGDNSINVAAFHPRLFSQLILIEPILGDCTREGIFYAYHTMNKPDQWPSLTKAAEYVQITPPFNTWDQRVVKRWLDYGIVRCSESEGAVRLVTSREREAYTYVRPIHGFGKSNHPKNKTPPDYIEDFDRGRNFYCPAATITMTSKLAEIRPPVYYIFGGNSVMSPEAKRLLLVSATGTKLGDNDDCMKVESSILPGIGHLAPFEDPKTCSLVLAIALARGVDDSVDEHGVSSSKQISTKAMSDTWRTALKKEMDELKKWKRGRL